MLGSEPVPVSALGSLMILVHMARVSVQVPTWYKDWGLHYVQCGLGTTALEAAP